MGKPRYRIRKRYFWRIDLTSQRFNIQRRLRSPCHLLYLVFSVFWLLIKDKNDGRSKKIKFVKKLIVHAHIILLFLNVLKIVLFDDICH